MWSSFGAQQHRQQMFAMLVMHARPHWQYAMFPRFPPGRSMYCSAQPFTLEKDASPRRCVTMARPLPGGFTMSVFQPSSASVSGLDGHALLYGDDDLQQEAT